MQTRLSEIQEEEDGQNPRVDNFKQWGWYYPKVLSLKNKSQSQDQVSEKTQSLLTQNKNSIRYASNSTANKICESTCLETQPHLVVLKVCTNNRSSSWVIFCSYSGTSDPKAEVCPAHQALRTPIILDCEGFGVHAGLKLTVLSAFFHLCFVFVSLAEMCVYSNSAILQIILIFGDLFVFGNLVPSLQR